MVEFGKDIELLCSVNEATGPITYRFYKEAGSLLYQITSNETHAVWYKSKASKEDEGQYYCTASNRANRLKSSPQSNVLTVRGESRSQTVGSSVALAHFTEG